MSKRKLIKKQMILKRKFKKKLKIIEEIKSLVDFNININNAYNKFKKLKKIVQWKVPKRSKNI